MKAIKIFALLLAAGTMFTACDDDDMKGPGNPVMEVTGSLEGAHFGDVINLTVNASDQEVPLSTIHAELYFGDEMVSEKVIRTKESGVDYEVPVVVPYLPNIPNGKATLRLTLQNINFTITEKIYSLPISRANYPSLKLVAEDGTEYTMNREADNQYSVTGRFPAELKAKIVAPAVDDNASDITFGYENNEIKPGVEGFIPFSNSAPGRYTVSFNTFSFEGSPFVVLSFNGEKFEAIDETTSQLDMTLAKGDVITPDGFPNFNDWWLNPDFLTRNEDGSLTFNAYNGSYRFIADTKRQYFRIYKLNGSEPCKLNTDGTGAAWIIGQGIGHPSLNNEVGWTTENAICMAPVGEKTYQITLVGGKTVAVNSINFKFYGEMGWGGELKGDMLKSESNLVGVGTGSEADGGNGHDNGNLFLKDGVVLQDNGIYVFTLDLTQGVNNAILKVDFNGEQQFEEKPVYLNGVKMSTSDNALYSVVTELNQNGEISFREFSDLESLYYDPDYFKFDEDAFSITFLPVSGYYNVVLDKLNGTLSAKRVNQDGSDMTLGDGTGALWMMGWGVGSPTLDQQFGWDPGKAYCIAQTRPGVFVFTGKAGPEKGSAIGDRYRYDYLSFKFFHQNGWGGELGTGQLTMTGDTSSLLGGNGNFEIASGKQLEQGATYRMIIDLSAGIEHGTIYMEKL